jgi:hypothetical protein
MSSGKPEKMEEKKYAAKIESHGWDCIKITTQGAYGRTGRNDRLTIAAYGVHIFFEFKRDDDDEDKKKKAEKLQDYYHRRLKKMGHETHVVYTCDEAYTITLKAVEIAKAAFYNRSTAENKFYDKLDYSGGTTFEDCIRKGKRL